MVVHWADSMDILMVVLMVALVVVAMVYYWVVSMAVVLASTKVGSMDDWLADNWDEQWVAW